MQCRNTEIGCYHDKVAHFDGKDQCLVKGCNCKRFTTREDNIKKNL